MLLLPTTTQVKIKMVTADNEETTDITIEGDIEEINRFCKVGGQTVGGKG